MRGDNGPRDRGLEEDSTGRTAPSGIAAPQQKLSSRWPYLTVEGSNNRVKRVQDNGTETETLKADRLAGRMEVGKFPRTGASRRI